MKYAICLFTCFLVAGTAIGQEMSIDRPDQTDGASTVDPHDLQLESEFYVIWYTEHHTSVISSNLLRYGLIRNLELRLAVEQGLNRHSFITETAQGFYPVTAGFKFTVLRDKEAWPDIAIIGAMQVPVTNRHEEHHYWSPAAIIALEKKLGQFNLGVNGGIKQEAFEKAHIWQLSGDLKYELNKQFEVFVEYFTQVKKEAWPNQNADAGLLVHLDKKWMVFGAVGERLDAPNRNYFVNSGFAVKF